MKYYIDATITNLTTDNDKLTALTYLKDNYASKITSAKLRGDTDELVLMLVETVYQDMVDTITALKTKFGTTLIWELDAQDYAG